ncbi:MAG: TonB-dependent receptor [Chitinophagaceae bacterium]|nr:TonB-dependent receptor [Chitinophagaceae bacterium]MCW5927389.1 TonB-dependent receptor [Chitinophagaceae bacterium]
MKLLVPRAVFRVTLDKFARTIRVLKFIIFLLIFISMKVNGKAYAQGVNISLKKAPLVKIFEQIQKQTKYQFLYPDELLASKQKVSVNVSGASVKEVLDKYLLPEMLEYVIDDNIIIIRKKLLVPDHPAKVADIDISGKVVNDRGEPVSGASIIVKGTNTGTSSDASGNFKLQVSQNKVTLVISSVGFETKEITVTGNDPVNVVLTTKDDTAEEIIVIGYGTQKKVDVTGAISVISAADVNQGVNQSVPHALQGRAAGVTVIQNSGAPGEGVEIRVRGSGSINNNSPLYVVDGIISGDINSLNPADIESISVLKDAASAAIYGSRGANGVVIVTTKKGKRDQKTSISYNTSHGIQQAWRMPEALNAEQRNIIHKEALTNDGTPASDQIWDYYNNPDNAVTRTDWFREVLKPAYIASHDLAIRGGSSRSNYSFSLGYLDNNGIVMGTNAKRYNIRFNSQHELFKNLTLGENIAAVVNDQKAGTFRAAYDGVLSSAFFNMRNIPVYVDRENEIYGTPSGDFPNPVASLNSRDNRNRSIRLGGNVYLEYKFMDMFALKTDFAYNVSYNKNKNFTAIARGGGRGLTENSLSESFATGNSWIWNNTITFDKSFGDHHVTALAGMSSEAGYNDWTNTGSGRNFSNQDPALRYLSNANNFPDRPSGSAEDQSLVGYFGRISYAFGDRYLLAANIRRDGSSRFAPAYRWGTFPSVSGGWRISKENFFKPVTDVVSDLKIRASWGQLGNDKIPNYQFYSTVSSVGTPTLGGEAFTSVAQNRMANTTIKWEVTTQTDIGIDIGFMRNRLLLSADYFDKKTTDILVRVPLVSSYGVGEAPFRNAGAVSNKGFEISATFRDAGTRKLGYEITANVATVKNKLETLGVTGAREIFTSDYKNTLVGRMAAGEALGHFYVLKSLGIFQTQSEIDGYVDKDGNKIQPNAVPGDLRFQDTNGDGVISAEDRINAGNSFPQFTYSLNTSVNYGGFDLNMMWSGSQGNKIFNGLTLGGKLMQGTGYNNGVDILNRWTPQNTNADIPRVSVRDLNNNRAYSTFYIEDGSFVRMKYLTLGYTLNSDLVGKNISKLRVFLTFQNLITITRYSGFDPEIGADVDYNTNMFGVDRGIYPQAKAYILGINFNF